MCLTKIMFKIPSNTRVSHENVIDWLENSFKKRKEKKPLLS